MGYSTSPLEKLLQDLKEYFVIQRRLITTIASKKGADIAFVLITGTVFFLLGLFIVILFSFTAAYGLALLLGNTFLGFLIVTAFYILVFGLIWIFKDWLIKRPLLKAFLRFLDTPKPSEND